MQRLIVSMKEQGVLFAEYYLDDRLPKTHEVYAFDAVLQQMDMSELMESYSAEGGKLYSLKDMLAVLLYAYSKGITSSYRIANEVQTNMATVSNLMKLTRRQIKLQLA